jgi:cysteine synthase A
MAQQLASKLGLAVGISSGANFIAALMLQLKGESEFVATVFPDDNKKYLTTALLSEEPVKDSYLAPGVELLGYRAFNRVCSACLDPSDELEELCIAPVP